MMNEILRSAVVPAVLFANLACFQALASGRNPLDSHTLSPLVCAPAPAKLAVDGDISEWDMTGSQVVYVDETLFKNENAEVALFHDADNLYFVADVTDSSPLRNIHSPTGRFWLGDGIQLRLFTAKNPAATPLRSPKDIPSNKDNRIVHCAFYRQHTVEKNWALFDYSFKFNDRAANPAGVEMAVTIRKDGSGYAMEVKIPRKIVNMNWSPKSGDFIKGVVEINFGNPEGSNRLRHANGFYTKNPGDFGFLGGSNWGTITFSDSTQKKRLYPSRNKIAKAIGGAKASGTPIILELKMPANATINIFAKNGKLVREIVTEKPLPTGRNVVYWDGLDLLGKPVSPGKYYYRVEYHKPITAEYLGSTDSSGTPPYENSAGTGGWGGDHSNPLAVTVDSKGTTFLWPRAELGKAIVRIDNSGKTLWRKIPFFDSSGNFYVMASDGDYIYLIHETMTSKPKLFRLSAANGELVKFSGERKAVPLNVANFAKPDCPPGKRPVFFDLSATGLAVDSKRIYVSIYPDDKILVLNKRDASLLREIRVPGPRSLAISADGNVLATSLRNGNGTVYKISTKTWRAVSVIKKGLEAPWGVCELSDGRMVVSDLGASQQLKVFSSKGMLVKTLGTKGGRALGGKYVPGSFLRPAGLAALPDGGFILAEHSLPSVINRLSKDFRITKQWFGPGNYAHAVWADCDNPYLIYSMMQGGVLRSVLDPKDKSWRPDAYWCFEEALRGIPKKRQKCLNIFKDFPQFAKFIEEISYPQIVRLGETKFMSSDSPTHPIVRIDGDTLTPVAFCELRGNDIHLWSDLNGNGRNDAGETAKLATLTAKTGKTRLNSHVGSQTFSPGSGAWYLAGGERIYKIPLKEVKNKVPIFDTAKAALFIADVSGEKRNPFHSSYRWGILGMREDSTGNLYALYTYFGKTPGVGHSSDISRVFVAKFAPNGECLWRRGAKAASFARPGEIYNPWVMAGIIADKLIAVSDETGGMIHFYDSDGFYRGKIFADYAKGDSAPGPYLFHGENFSGRVQYFPKLRKALAYQGMTDSRAFSLSGWDAPVASANGEVELRERAKIGDESEKPAILAKVPKLPKNLLGDDFWRGKPKSAIKRSGKRLAVFALAMDSANLAFRFVVNDKSPLMNSADSAGMAFKGGDAVDLYFGPYTKMKRENPVLGDVRIIATMLKGKPVMVAMRPVSTLNKPCSYANPGGYIKQFDYVGEIPDARIAARRTDGGYIVAGTIPLKFLEPLSLKKDAKIAFDADILGSDASGKRTATRIFWHSRGASCLTMTQDVPTECWLYPRHWGILKLSGKKRMNINDK